MIDKVLAGDIGLGMVVEFARLHFAFSIPPLGAAPFAGADGVIDHALFFEFSEDATELSIDVGNTDVVAVDDFFGLLIRAGAFFENAIVSAEFAPSC